MGDRELQRGYKGLQGITGVTSGYMVLQLVTRGYKGIECPQILFLVYFAEKGYKE